jgi:hypothetical protein
MIYGVCRAKEYAPPRERSSRERSRERTENAYADENLPSVSKVTVSLWAIEEGGSFARSPIAIYTDERAAYDRARAEYAAAKAQEALGEVREVVYKSTLSATDIARADRGGVLAPRLLPID